MVNGSMTPWSMGQKSISKFNFKCLNNVHNSSTNLLLQIQFSFPVFAFSSSQNDRYRFLFPPRLKSPGRVSTFAITPLPIRKFKIYNQSARVSGGILSYISYKRSIAKTCDECC